MQINAVLANHAEVADNLLFVSGGGIQFSNVAPQPPHQIQVGIGIVVHVPYTATNEPHRLTVALLDEDSLEPVLPWSPPDFPAELVAPVTADIDFNVGRPAQLAPGDVQSFASALNLMVPLPHLGLYKFTIAIDGTVAVELPLRVQALQ